jgi:hypothetical protein
VHQAPITEVFDLLEATAPVFVRYGASAGSDGWELRFLDVTTGEAPPSWRPTIWRYPSALFVACETAGLTAAHWLRSGQIGEEAIPVQLHEQASVERRDSAFEGALEQLEWPFVEWRLTSQRTLNSVVQEELVGDGVPSFASFDVAVAALLGVQLTRWNLSGSEYTVRVQDRRGRFERVVLGAGSLVATVSGDDLDGTAVELAGERPGPAIVLADGQEQDVSFPLPDGLPAGAWLLIKQGTEWLDRRYLGWPYAGARPRGVEIVVSPEAQLEALVSAGENSSLEFKRELPTAKPESIRKVLKTAAAFANGAGGTILFGVDNDGVMIGLDETNLRVRADDRLAQIVKAWVHPLPPYELTWLPLPDGSGRVLALELQPGPRPPYAAGTGPENLVYYVRRGATTFAVMPDEIRAIVLARGAESSVIRPYTSPFET